MDMSAPDITSDVMKKFGKLSTEKHLTILLGAGASMPSGLPSWNTFTERLLQSTGLAADLTKAQLLLKSRGNDPTFLLQAAKNSAGERWHSDLFEALYQGFADPDDPDILAPSDLHLAVAQHWLTNRETTTLSTLNYDILLENALTDALCTAAERASNEGEDRDTSSESSNSSREVEVLPITEIDDDLDATKLGANKAAVYHLHGVIAKGRTHQPVVTFHDYAALQTNSQPWQFTFLKRALARGPLLLMGTTYRDPDIRLWLHILHKQGAVTHPALVPIIRQDLGLEPALFTAFRQTFTQEWSSVGLTTLFLEDFNDLVTMVRELEYRRSSTTRSYLSPNLRARKLWKKHESKRTELAPEYSEILEKDATQVAKALDTGAFRPTLWLSRKKGKIIRFATAGVTYQTVADLKTVPTGHDSRWIAGEALSKARPILRNSDRSPDIEPTWKSVLAIPVFIGDGTSPEIAAAVLTFGLQRPSEDILAVPDSSVDELCATLSQDWGTRLSRIAFTP